MLKGGKPKIFKLRKTRRREQKRKAYLVATKQPILVLDIYLTI
jgi:hypothetical protein